MSAYTVLLLRPPHQREGHPSDWVARIHAAGRNSDEAAGDALRKLERGIDGISSADPLEVHVLAIYEGHLFDHFQP